MSAGTQIADTAGAVLLFLGAAVSLLGALGMVRMPDVLSRSHAATNPQSLGMLLVLAGVALRLRSGIDLGTLGLVGFFQLLTGPVSAHLVARVAYRTGYAGREGLVFDDLDAQLSAVPQDGEGEGDTGAGGGH
ncbi:Na+/H+ antiporter subunit G [Streptomyces sp. SID4919]|uniref:monovalent cation/H(+) antiporter subunit G n=1 Tax=unclassified Streptomyces TaxID=2593676 RepID=UPI000823A9CC|nr:monovalent cation/H(+) antiporter subunit G [Streptomyces sp. AmelKG-E11A]MYY10532.1 Na+/H+ antiporter subunit G [Streptomyces sp. SID4919]SCK47198.1 multisubunit sodium/proton antiporter, MrpG subunit [Streptomyces sp. AmelKG-E11A]